MQQRAGKSIIFAPKPIVKVNVCVCVYTRTIDYSTSIHVYTGEINFDRRSPSSEREGDATANTEGGKLLANKMIDGRT